MRSDCCMNSLLPISSRFESSVFFFFGRAFHEKARDCQANVETE